MLVCSKDFKVMGSIISHSQNAFVEGGQILLAHAVEGNFLSSCKFEARVKEKQFISHLLYADDTILFAKQIKNRLCIRVVL